MTFRTPRAHGMGSHVSRNTSAPGPTLTTSCDRFELMNEILRSPEKWVTGKSVGSFSARIREVVAALWAPASASRFSIWTQFSVRPNLTRKPFWVKAL